MPTLLLISAEPLAGKTTVAVGLARQILTRGKKVALRRLPGGGSDAADGALFQTVVGASAGSSVVDVRIWEAPAGDPSKLLRDQGDARVVAVLSSRLDPGDAAQFVGLAGSRLAAIVVNRVPEKRTEAIRKRYESVGLPIALVAEDRTLAAPTLGDIKLALNAAANSLSGLDGSLVERPVIASVAVDPGQAYFSRTGAVAVIVRSDKPDHQLGALNAGARCLIVTGGSPLLSYVRDRAQEAGIPLLRTSCDTIKTIDTIEAMFGAQPFSGGEAKLARIDALLVGLDLAALGIDQTPTTD